MLARNSVKENRTGLKRRLKTEQQEEVKNITWRRQADNVADVHFLSIEACVHEVIHKIESPLYTTSLLISQMD
jgi:hypothetical protein